MKKLSSMNEATIFLDFIIQLLYRGDLESAEVRLENAKNNAEKRDRSRVREDRTERVTIGQVQFS